MTARTAIRRKRSTAEVLAWPPLVPAWPDVADVLQIGKTMTHELIAKDEFPVPVIRIGRLLRCRKTDVLTLLGLQDQAAAEVESAASAEENGDAPGVEPGAPVEQRTALTSR